MTQWSLAELEFLVENSLKMTYREIAAVLGHTENSVRSKASEMGLRKKASEFSAEEKSIIRQCYEQNIPLNEIAKSLGRRKTSVCRVAGEMGLADLARPKSEEHRLKMRNATAERIKQKGHPRGMKGKHHSEGVRKKIGDASRAAWKDPESGHNTDARSQRIREVTIERIRAGDFGPHDGNPYSRVRGGYRVDLELYVRSAWEANYARYLNFLIEAGQVRSWRYEATSFHFPVKRGTRSYTPDFKVERPDGSVEYHEVKGWMTQKSRMALVRMKLYWPSVTVVVIGAKEYRGLVREFGHALGFEE